MATAAWLTTVFGLLIWVWLLDGAVSLHDIRAHFILVHFDVDVVYGWSTCLRVVGVLSLLPHAKIWRLFNFLRTTRRVICLLWHLAIHGQILDELAVLVLDQVTLRSLREDWRYISIHVVWHLIRNREAEFFHSRLRFRHYRLFRKKLMRIASVLIPELGIAPLALFVKLLLLLLLLLARCLLCTLLLGYYIDLYIVESNELVLLCVGLYLAELVVSLAWRQLPAQVLIIRINQHQLLFLILLARKMKLLWVDIALLLGLFAIYVIRAIDTLI